MPPPTPFPTPTLIGVVHLPPLPGSPHFAGSIDAVLQHASRDAATLAENGIDAIIVENFGDAPFHKTAVPPETIAAMALALREVRQVSRALPVGVNVLRNDARSALGLCAATGATFLRVNVLTGACVTDQGIIEGDAANLSRERARLAPHTLVFADVHVKHATPLGDESIAQAAREALGRGGADGVIVSGRATGDPPDEQLLREVREGVGAGRIWIGSGLDASNAAAFLSIADGAIVGTSLKVDGRVENPVDAARVARLRKIVDGS